MTKSKFTLWFTITGLLFHFTAFSQEILTLEQAIKIALENNFNIKLAQADVVISNTNNTYGNAGFLPEINLNFNRAYNINNTRQQFFSGDTREGNNVNSNNLNANIQLNWRIFDGMNMFVQKNRLEKMEEMSFANLRLETENLTSNVIQNFHIIQQLKKRITVLDSAISLSQTRRKLAIQKENIGVGSGQDILQTTVDINTDSTALVRQLWEIENAKVALNLLLARDPNTDFEVALENPNYEALLFEPLWDRTLRENSQLNILDKSIQLADLNIKQAKTRYLPVVSLNTGYTFARSAAEIGILQFNQNSGMTYGVTGTWTLFSGFNNKRQTQIAKLEYDNQVLIKEQNIQSLKGMLAQTFNQYLMNKELERIEQKNIEVAQKNLDISMEKMRIGTITGFEIREAQKNVIDAEFRYIDTQYMSRIAEIELLRISGQLKLNN